MSMPSSEAANAGPAGRTRGRRAQELAGYASSPVRLLFRYVRQHPAQHVVIPLGIVAAVGCSLGSQFAIRNLVDALPAGRAHPAHVIHAFLVIVVLLLADNLFWRIAG